MHHSPRDKVRDFWVQLCVEMFERNKLLLNTESEFRKVTKRDVQNAEEKHPKLFKSALKGQVKPYRSKNERRYARSKNPRL